MASRRRGRRVNVSWAPPLVPGTIQEQDDSFLNFDQSLVHTAPGHVISIFPITFDYPNDPSTATVATHSMADFIGSAYILKRIVGKVFAAQLPSVPGVSSAAIAMVGAGFFVARASDTTPAAPAGSLASYDPLASANMMEPWIWRRTWVLGNANDVSGVIYPSSTAWYGSAMDGPHIDSRVKRRVNDDDRLWFVAAAADTVQNEAEDPTIIRWFLDYRLLVTLRKNKNQSAF